MKGMVQVEGRRAIGVHALHPRFGLRVNLVPVDAHIDPIIQAPMGWVFFLDAGWKTRNVGN